MDLEEAEEDNLLVVEDMVAEVQVVEVIITTEMEMETVEHKLTKRKL